MCEVSPHGGMGKSIAPSSFSMSAPTIRPMELLKNREKYILVDIREPEECKNDPIENAINVPLGLFLFKSAIKKLEELLHVQNLKESQRTIVTACNIGYRSGIAAREALVWGYSAVSLEGGHAGLKDPASLNYDFAVVIAIPEQEKLGKDVPKPLKLSHAALDKCITAFVCANASQKNGASTAVAINSDLIVITLKGALDDSVAIGEPFPTLPKVIQSYLDAGGMIFGCKSCLVSRKINTTEDCEPWLRVASAPDITRWIANARGSMVFS